MHFRGMKIKGFKIQRSFFISPFFLAIPITVILLFLIPDLFPGFNAKHLEAGLVDKKSGLEYYEDIDQDGSDERIIYFNNTQNQASIKVIEDNGEIGEHFYFSGRIIPQTTAVSFGEKSAGGAKLIFVYTLSGDSLLLNVVDYGGKGRNRISVKFIDRIEIRNDSHDFVLPKTWCTDLDHDGVNEFVGGILAGFSLKPRHWFIYDMRRDTMVFSPSMGVWFDITCIDDVNGDGKKELIASTYSISNYPDSMSSPFDDHSAWIMAFDHQFNFLFRPVQYKGKYIHIITQPVTIGGKKHLAILVYQTSPGKTCPCLVLADINGKTISERKLRGRGLTYQLYIPSDKPGKMLLCDKSGSVEEINENLQTTWKKEVADKNLNLVMNFDFDRDGKIEHLCTVGTLGQLAIFREDFSKPALLDIPLRKCTANISKRVMKEMPPQIFVQIEDTYYLYVYGKNPLFFLKYLFYAGIYLVILLIIWLSQYFQRRIFNQRYEAEQQISALQLEFFKKQFDPHFAFNLLNTISATLLQKDPESAQRDILKMATLMRSSISSSGNLSRTLAEELGFTSAYLDLVKVSYDDKFRYDIMVHPEVDLETMIPRMVIQAHAENAFKHGIRPKEKRGQITIEAALKDERLIVTIEDDGIGREQAAGMQKASTGKGIEIMDGFFRLFNKFNKHKIIYTIEDLFNQDQKPAGTRVIISIPLKYNYHLFENK
jgi:two-component sensor histidine kinase